MISNTTLQDLFLGLTTRSNLGLTFINGSDDDINVSYKELFDNALNTLGVLQEFGISEGDELVFQLNDPQNFIQAFWACILGRIIPVPVNLAVTADLKTKLKNVFNVLNSPYLITTRENFSKNLSVDNEQEDLFKGRVIFVNDDQQDHFGEIKKAASNDVAYIQFSSGSTGNPKV